MSEVPRVMHCEQCGLSILHKYAAVLRRWMATRHHAPAGILCIGGGAKIGEPYYRRPTIAVQLGPVEEGVIEAHLVRHNALSSWWSGRPRVSKGETGTVCTCGGGLDCRCRKIAETAATLNAEEQADG